MFARKRNQAQDERLDRVGRSLVRASKGSEAEIEAAASSPFLYARLRAHIRAEQDQREARERWFAVLAVVRRAVPAMAMMAILAFSSWFAMSRVSPAMSFSLEAFLGSDDAELEQVAFAEQSTLTNDEVLSAIIEDDEREAAR